MKSNDTPFRPRKLLTVIVGLVVPLTLFAHAAAAANPGEGNGNAAPSAAASANSLTQFKAIVGQVVLSEDACGTNTPSPTSSCTVDILKPSASATVREADLFCATTGGSGYSPQNGDVTVNGVPVAWDQIIPNAILSFNARDDVTTIVKPVGDAALPGLVSFTIGENPTVNYDGCAMKVIWDDPTTTVNSILIFWGAQDTTGDTFVINFTQPLDANAFLAPLEFSLGISFGAQGCAVGQFSQVDVNSVRLTTSAGGEDDGSCENGALVTLGGTGDTAANPPPLAPPTAVPSVPDDELYDLRPFVNVGDTSMTIFTLNPSNDDNIFLANLFLRNVRVITPEPVPTTLTLEPFPTDVNPVGTQHCVTATVRDQFGEPMEGIVVRFSVSGSVSASGSATTDANGEAEFCYTGPVFPGADDIHAYADTDEDSVQDLVEPFGDTTKTWVLPVSTPGCKVSYGGRITAANGDKATFGGNAKVPDSVPQGQEEYQDHGPAVDINVHSIDVDAVTCSEDGKSASIFGTATINGSGTFDYRIDVTDNGEPGTADTYRIRLSNGYDSGVQTLAGGNVQVH
jgi:hypothetical protein